MKPLKILLLNIPNLHEIEGNDPVILKKCGGIYPPLGLLYIASYLKKNTPHYVEFFDCQLFDVSYEKLGIYLRKEKFDIIGISAITLALIDVKMTIDLIKKVSPETKIIVGGAHATIYPNETLNLRADTVVRGEGERSFIDAISSNGIIPYERIENLDLLPFPYRPYTDKYYSILSPHKITTMFTSRGCPYQCIYCDRPSMGKKFRARSPMNVVNEMEECVKMGVKEIFFYDDTFTIDKNRVMNICDEIIQRDLKVKWDIRARVDTINYSMLNYMREAGCHRIHFGVESGSQKILDKLEKGITIEQVKDAFKWAKELNISTMAYFMIGSPNETLSDINESYLLSKKLNADYAQFTILTPFPATKLYSMWLEAHDNDIWQDFALNPKEDFKPPIWNETLSREELKQILSKIYRSYYFRPGSIWNKVKGVKSLGQLKRYISAGLELIKEKT